MTKPRFRIILKRTQVIFLKEFLVDKIKSCNVCERPFFKDLQRRLKDYKVIEVEMGDD